MQGTVKCHKCQRVGASNSMHYENENMVIKLCHPNAKDVKQRRRLYPITVMSGVHYCTVCYPNYQAVIRQYQTNKTKYLVAGTLSANQFIDQYKDVFAQANIISGLHDEAERPIFLFGAVRDVFKHGAKRQFEANNIYKTLGLLPPPPPPSSPPPSFDSNRNRSNQSRRNGRNQSRSKNENKSKPKEGKRGCHWIRKEVRDFVQWMQLRGPKDVKSLETYLKDNGFAAYMATKDHPSRTENAYARLYEHIHFLSISVCIIGIKCTVGGNQLYQNHI